MRILAVTNLYPTPIDPTRAPFNAQQFRALAESHRVRILAPISWTEELGTRLRTRTLAPIERRRIHQGMLVEHPRYWFPPRCLRRWYGWFYERSIRAAFTRAVKEFRPDLVFATWAYPDGWATVRLARQVGLPVVIKVHGCDVLWGLRNTPDKQLGTAQALQGCDAVVAVSQHLADNVCQFGVDPTRVAVVYNGLDHDVFCPGSPSRARERLGLSDDVPLLLCVANLFRVKGLDVLISACAELAKGGLPFQCVLVGEGPLRAQLQRQIQSFGPGAQVRLVGSAAHGTLPDWYRAASVVVVPSRSEGVPSVLLEAIACGARFVATNVGGVAEIAHFGHGRLVPPEDPVALATALRAALEAAPREKPVTAYQRSHRDAARELADVFASVLARPALLTCQPS